MAVGRNDPCPCGSGKKYKKCCQGEQQVAYPSGFVEPPARPAEAAADRQSEPVRTEPVSWPAGSDVGRPPEGPKETDPHIEAINRRWEEFEAGDYESRIACYLQTLGEPDLMDGDLAFDMAEKIYFEAVRRGDLDRFTLLVRALEERLPAVYNDHRVSFLSLLIDAAVAQGRFDGIGALAQEIAACATDNIDIFNLCLDPLAYHGQLDALVEMLRAAWPGVKASRKIVPWGIDEFFERAVRYEVLRYLGQTDSPHGDDPVLLERLRFYRGGVNPASVSVHVDLLCGRIPQPATYDPPTPPEVPGSWFVDEARDEDDWDDQEQDEAEATDSLEPDEEEPDETPDDEDEWDDGDEEDEEWEEDDESFDEDDGPLDDEEEGEEDDEESFDPRALWCGRLCREFIGYLCRQEGVPLVKADLAADNLAEYLLRRMKGKLRGAPPLYDPGNRPTRRKGKARFKQARAVHVLCPDAPTFDPYLGGMLQFLSTRYHRVAATMELVPAWLRFLRSRGLVDATDEARTLDGLAGVHRDLLKFWEDFHEDPSLHEAAIATWRRRPVESPTV
jgi:hypothetical protein